MPTLGGLKGAHFQPGFHLPIFFPLVEFLAVVIVQLMVTVLPGSS